MLALLFSEKRPKFAMQALKKYNLPNVCSTFIVLKKGKRTKLTFLKNFCSFLKFQS
jgi:hypothetical protein